MKNKRGMTVKQIVGLILGVAVAAILIFLLIKLLAPTFDVEEETAKSYFEQLEKAIEKADKGEVGEFVIWRGNCELIYFGSQLSHKSLFSSDKIDKNEICICCGKVCQNCMELKYPASWCKGEGCSSFNDISWSVVASEGNAKIRKKKNPAGKYYYVFELK